MSKFSKLLAAVAVVPILAFAGSAYATSNPGQLQQGDIYRVRDLNTSPTFADNITASCGDTVQFRVLVQNGGPAALTNVKASATLNQSSATTSHGSQVSLSADNNLNGTVVTANAGVNTSEATTATYVSGSTQLLSYSNTPGDESVLRTLPDGILSGGVNIGTVGPLTSQGEEVQFEAKLNCPAPVTPSYACTILGLTAEDNRTVKISNFATTQSNATFSNATITWGDNTELTSNSPIGQTHQYAVDGKYTVTATANFNVGGQTKSVTSASCTQVVTFSPTAPPTVTPPTTPVTPPAAPTALVNTGPGSVIGLFAAATLGGTVLYRRLLARRLSRQ